MADEAFALSPISARATLPSEEDYAAIAEAFMETSRGRWFLTEYAKRNRNADTRMVLDAVAKIEQSLTAQREENLQREAALQREEGLSAQQAAEAVAAAAAAQERLSEALDAIRGAVDAAEESAVEALDSLALDQRLAPVRKGARVLREIAWRLREIGNDGRICDLIDSQVTVIEKGTDQFSSSEARAALRGAFAALQSRLGEVGDDENAPRPPLETDAMALFPEVEEMPPAAEPIGVADVAEAAETTAETVEAVLTIAETPPATEFAAPTEDVPAQVSVFEETIPTDDPALDSEALDEAVAEDEAVLDIIAMEMGAPDPITDEDIAEAIAEQVRTVEPAPAVQEIVIGPPEPAAWSLPTPVQAAAQPPAPPAAAVVTAVEVSLGSTLIASGMVRKPVTAANDPLAPIRRMSQAEKIAFFS